MSNWSEGYVTGADYIYGYYKELNPNQMTIPFLMANVVSPKVETACELGFGQGVSVNVNAAASNAQWFANDFNPNHVSFADDIANSSGAKVTLTDEAFAEFCIREDLPDFDFIGLHGIWTWVSDQNRQIIVDFISRKLKVGGVLYISYNNLPGWSAHTPIRHVMTQHERTLSSNGQPIANRIYNALEFTKELFSHTHSLNQQSPQIQERVEKLTDKSANYLAHEYFNKDWKPMYFSEVSDWLAPAKLSYVCSPNFNDDFHALTMFSEQVDFVNQIHDVSLKQTIIDYMLCRQFRKDYWVKGVRKLTATEEYTRWSALSFLLKTPLDDVKLSAGLAELKPSIYQPLLDVLSDYKIHSFSDIEQILKNKHDLSLDTIYQCLAILHSKDDIAVIFPDPDKQVVDQCRELNKKLVQLNLDDIILPYLVSPLTRNVVDIDYSTHLLLAARQEHGDDIDKCVNFVWETLQKNNRLMVVEGKTLESAEENIAELKKRADQLAKHSLHIYKTLELIDS